MDERFLRAEEPRVAGNSLSVTNNDTGNIAVRDFRLRKSEILRGYKSFADILAQGRYVEESGVRCFFEIRREIPPAACTVGFAVRRAKNAVVRNQIKRWMREAYRLNKHILREACEKKRVYVGCVLMAYAGAFLDKDGYSKIENSIVKILNILREEVLR